MKWVTWFILACVGVVAIFLIGVWIQGGLHGLGQNLEHRRRRRPRHPSRPAGWASASWP